MTDTRLLRLSKNAENKACIAKSTQNLNGRGAQMARSPNNYPRFVSKAIVRFLPFNLISGRRKEKKIIYILATQIPCETGCLNSVTKLNQTHKYMSMQVLIEHGYVKQHLKQTSIFLSILILRRALKFTLKSRHKKSRHKSFQRKSQPSALWP